MGVLILWEPVFPVKEEAAGQSSAGESNAQDGPEAKRSEDSVLPMLRTTNLSALDVDAKTDLLCPQQTQSQGAGLFHPRRQVSFPYQFLGTLWCSAKASLVYF